MICGAHVSRFLSDHLETGYPPVQAERSSAHLEWLNAADAIPPSAAPAVKSTSCLLLRSFAPLIPRTRLQSHVW